MPVITSTARPAFPRRGRSLRLIAAGCVLAGALSGVPAVAAAPLEDAAGAPSPGAPAVPGALLVTTRTSADLRRLGDGSARPLGGRVALLTVRPGTEGAAAARLRRDPRVVAVEPDRLRALAAVPNDPEYSRQWAHALAGAPAAWDALLARDRTVGSRELRVAVIDSGIQADHPDLRANVLEQVDVSVDPPVAVGPGVDNDGCGLGHGTLVAGILGASGNNRRGVAGVAWQVGIIDVAVSSPRNPDSCDRIAGVPDSAILRGIQHAAGRGADVINLSLAAFQSACPAAYQAQIDAARAGGAVIVAAAGNGQQRAATRGLPSVPASCDGVISVGATMATGHVAGYSTGNRWVDLVAPGGSASTAGGCAGSGDCVLSTARGGGTAVDLGTSFAAAYVSGAAALLRAVNPDLTPDEIEALLEQTADDLDPPGRDPSAGWGAVRLDRAVGRAAAAGGMPRPAADPPFPVSDGSAAPPVPNNPVVTRVSAGTGTTAPVPQAIAVSREVFGSGEAAHVVLAASGSYADALAGSALGFGVGPLLFTAAGEPLDARVRAEVNRVLPAGGRAYLLGGRAGIAPAVEVELRSAGYDVVRLSGPGREETAAAVARETARRLAELGVAPPRTALLVTRSGWADAVTAGGIAAYFGVPVLLTPTESLHPATASVLAELRPTQVYVVGGTRVVSEAAAAEAGAAAGTELVTRLAGGSRDATAVAVAGEVEAIFARAGLQPRFAVAVNVGREDGFAHALSASALVGAFSGVFVPVLGDRGEVITDVVAGYVRGMGIDGIVVGDADAVAPATLHALEALLDGRSTG